LENENENKNHSSATFAIKHNVLKSAKITT